MFQLRAAVLEPKEEEAMILVPAMETASAMGAEPTVLETMEETDVLLQPALE